MEIRASERDGISILEVIGRLTAVSSSSLKSEFKKQIDGGIKTIVIDMGKMDFIDSSGLSSLISGLKQCREVGGSLRLCCLTDQTMKVLQITLLNRVFPIFSTIDEALSSLEN